MVIKYCQMTERVDFAEWLNEQLDIRGWRQADLIRASAKSGGNPLHSGYLSKILNSERQPGVKVVRQIALGLDLPEEEVQRRAGLLSIKKQQPESKTAPRTQEAVREYDKLTDEEQESILQQMKGLNALKGRRATREAKPSS